MASMRPEAIIMMTSWLRNIVDYDVIYVLDIIPDVSLDRLYISAHQIIQVTFMVIRCAYGSAYALYLFCRIDQSEGC